MHVFPAQRSSTHSPLAQPDAQKTKCDAYEQEPELHDPGASKTFSVVGPVHTLGGGASHLTPKHDSPRQPLDVQPLAHATGDAK
jgi:hypothetical protein